MTPPDPASNVASSDRRTSSREPSLGRARVVIPEGTLTGTLENQSPQGMFIVLDEALEVQVTLQTGDEEQTSSARLTRVASLPGKRTGWGLEIINDSSVA